MAMLHNNAAYQLATNGHNGASHQLSTNGHNNGVSHIVTPRKANGLTVPADKSSVMLSSGFMMPIVGLGVFRVDGKDIKDLILSAIRLGYRHFDCAAKYGNEGELGEALAEAMRQGLVKREELFITTKIWNSDHGHVVEACKDSLKKLKLDYLDLYLVHYPMPTKHAGIGKPSSLVGEDGILEISTTVTLESTWRGMEEVVSLGLVRSIGISNYNLLLTRDCLAYSKIKPAVHQFETHPYFQRQSLVKFCQKHGICVTAHTPLGGAGANGTSIGSILDDPVLMDLAEKYKKSVAQVVLRWNIQRNVNVIPKSVKKERVEQNYQVFDFELTNEDMDMIKTLDQDHRTNVSSKNWNIDIFQ